MPTNRKFVDIPRLLPTNTGGQDCDHVGEKKTDVHQPNLTVGLGTQSILGRPISTPAPSYNTSGIANWRIEKDGMYPRESAGFSVQSPAASAFPDPTWQLLRPRVSSNHRVVFDSRRPPAVVSIYASPETTKSSPRFHVHKLACDIAHSCPEMLSLRSYWPILAIPFTRYWQGWPAAGRLKVDARRAWRPQAEQS